MTLPSSTCTAVRPLTTLLDWLQSPFNLLVRVWVGKVFFDSGLTKIQSWDTTVALFAHEYQVPLLSPTLAALLGTGAELVLPVLLVVGLGTRFAAAALFVFNIVAVISYPDLNEIGLKDHQYWGVLLLLPLVYGPGKLALDHWLCRQRQG
jgi:putative oxidoreductase